MRRIVSSLAIARKRDSPIASAVCPFSIPNVAALASSVGKHGEVFTSCGLSSISAGRFAGRLTAGED